MLDNLLTKRQLQDEVKMTFQSRIMHAFKSLKEFSLDILTGEASHIAKQDV